MKKLLFIKIPVAAVIITFLIASNVYSENSVPVKDNYESSLSTLSIIRGNYKLESKVTRSQFITWVVRSLGYDQDDTGKLTNASSDVKKGYWAYDSIIIALNYGFINVYPDKTIKPESLITPKDALVIMLKGLGCKEDLTKWTLKDLTDKSASIGLYKDLSITDEKAITFKQAYILLYNFLTVDFISQD